MLGIIARSDLGSGLQSQTYALCRMLKPSRVMLVNSKSFNNSDPRPEMYDGFNVQMTQGWPTNLECNRFVKGLTHVITAETAYNPKLYDLARLNGVKVFTQLNWEFLDHLVNPRQPKPYRWLMPSHWHLDEMKSLFSNTVYLPPPVFPSDFKSAREENFNKIGRRKFVHVMGRVATHDRNGTFDLVEALKYSTEDFELVIRSQHDIPEYTQAAMDPRITFDIRNVSDPQDLYRGFDLMIMPRRYGGLCLPMNEALISGLPVVMSNITPNREILPKEWLVPATKTGTFMARTKIDVHSSDPVSLGKRLDWFATMDDKLLSQKKAEAFDLGFNNYSADILRPSYMEVMEL